MADIKKLAEELTSLSVLEVKELKDFLKEEYGLEAAAPVAMAAAGAPAAAAEEAEEKTSFDVVLEGFGDAKIAVIKAVRELTGLGLKEAKDAVEAAPKPILQGVDKAKAEEAKEKINAAGGVATLA
ncbi:MAG: 50S ribosomal protein L7/L12 [Coriobacteriia bacterium]|nr:50S ribosomal protein L7/L12 [Coriobacteriia bacterium]MCL2750892.1 50S ribosomal protein L7/L12 [Coriobacteriia bacterium]